MKKKAEEHSKEGHKVLTRCSRTALNKGGLFLFVRSEELGTGHPGLPPQQIKMKPCNIPQLPVWLFPNLICFQAAWNASTVQFLLDNAAFRLLYY
jgi:hypothetical protein